MCAPLPECPSRLRSYSASRNVAHDIDDAVTRLRERGYAVLPSVYPRKDVDALRAALLELYDEIDRPPASTEHPHEPQPGVEVGPAGIVFHQLATRRPDLVPLLLRPEPVAVVRGLLGDDMRLELPAGVISDHNRPFFEWHTHIGGVDDATLGYAREYPTFERSQRVTMLHYLDDLTPDNSPLLVLPRRIDEPTGPPYPQDQAEWPGQEAIHCPAGSVVILEQCTWHAAPRKVHEGLRLYIGFYFAAAEAPTSPLEDDTLGDYDGDCALFRSVTRRRDA